MCVGGELFSDFFRYVYIQDEALFGSQVTLLQEIRCLVCSYFHHTFICDPPLVKLVHFQVIFCMNDII